MQESGNLKRNREIARQINERALRDPSAPYSGKYIAVIDGAVAVAADTVGELGRSLWQMEVNRGDVFCIHVGHDYSKRVCLDSPIYDVSKSRTTRMAE